MISLIKLVRPLAKSIQGGKVVKKVKPCHSRTLKRSWTVQSRWKQVNRYYSQSNGKGDGDEGGIVTVDKWGVTRDAKESLKPQNASSSSASGRTTHVSGAPATEMPIFELSRMNFQESLTGETPVIVMAFLPSSELSMQLEQKLATRVMQLGGALRLGRLNASVEQELAMALKLTQLPTVIGVFGGRTVTSFVGVPEDKVIDEFVDIMLRVGGQQKLIDMATAANHALEVSGDTSLAQQLFSEILQNPTLKAEAIALAGLARCAIKDGKLENAKELLDIISNSYPKDLQAPEVQQAFSAFELSSNTSNISFDELEKRIKDNPDDFEARYELATSLWASSQQEKAIQAVLDLVKKDKQWNDQAGRKLLLKFWESMGPDHPLTVSSRKRFGAIWF